RARLPRRGGADLRAIVDAQVDIPATWSEADSGTSSRRRRLRVYSTPPDQPRVRRATDLLLLLAGLAGTALLTAAYPPSGFERSFHSFLDSTPGWLDPVWSFLYDLLWLWPVLLVLTTAIARRYVVALQALASLVLVTLGAYVTARLAIGSWPDF